jgi:hypothetical protein
MAYILATSLGENRIIIDQEVDSDFFDNFELELDITSLLINGFEFSKVLSNPNIIKEYIEEIEEFDNLIYPIDALIAYLKGEFFINTRFSDIILSLDQYYISSSKKEAMVDCQQQFAVEHANQFLSSLSSYNIPENLINQIEHFFDYSSYQESLFINQVNCIDDGISVHFFYK